MLVDIHRPDISYDEMSGELVFDYQLHKTVSAKALVELDVKQAHESFKDVYSFNKFIKIDVPDIEYLGSRIQNIRDDSGNQAFPDVVFGIDSVRPRINTSQRIVGYTLFCRSI